MSLTLIQPASRPSNTNQPPRAAAICQDWVVLLHGLFASRRSMRKLERSLGGLGFQVMNWGYRTLWHTTEHHVQHLLTTLRRLQDDPAVNSIHFVTHSMGGILVRAALNLGRLDKVQRVVMLAPPNSGSSLTRISSRPIAWCVPTIADLSESPDSLANRLPSCEHVEVGIIAALKDFVVPVANTVLHNQRDHCVVPTTHHRLPGHELAIQQAIRFLQSGRFHPPVSVARAA